MGSRLCVVLAVVCGVAGSAMGQPDGGVIMRGMAKAVRDAGALRFEVKMEGVGSLSVKIPRGEAKVLMAPGEDGDSQWRYAVEGSMLDPESAEATELSFAFDGETMRALRPAEKKLYEGNAGDEDEAVPLEAARGLRWVWRWGVFVDEPFSAEESPYTPAWLGETKLDGQVCDIVRVDYSERPDVEELDLFWYVSREDHLPRRVEGTYFFGDGSGLSVVHVRDFKSSTVVPVDAFTIVMPEGYTVEKNDAGAQALGEPASGVPVGEKAPNWTLTDASGQERTLESFRGKVVLMDFWATWCGPCKMAMPGVQKLHEELADRGLVVLGVNCWDDPEAAKAYMNDKGYTYTTLLNGDEVAGAYGVNGIPTFYIIGADGRVLTHVVGHQPGGEEALKKLIEEHLAGGG